MILPSNYEFKEGVSNPLYKQYDGMNKVSYSQIGSFLNYKGDYIMQKFLGVDVPGNIFSDFGSLCGQYWETGDVPDELSVEDGEHLKRILNRPESATYEAEIVIDRGDYVIQGFIDQQDEIESGKLVISDLKTGNHKDKPLYYASKDYKQTGLYSYCRDIEGYEILKSQVILLERKGNGRPGHPLRLSGEVLYIDTPYKREEVELYLKGVDMIAEKISQYYKVYTDYLK